MSASIDWRIPPSTLRWRAEAPRDAPVAVLLRHSVRDHLPSGDAGHDLPITDVGVKLARGLGAAFGTRLRSLHTSPLVRCRQTAAALRSGASADITIEVDRLLGDPGVFVVDGQLAWSSWEARGHEGVMTHLVSGREPLPGMAAPDAAARFLVQHMLATAGAVSGLHVFITHDSLVTATAARLLEERLGVDDWPWYLEGAFWPAEPSRRS